MAVRVADSLKQQNDLKTFPVAYSEDIWIDENKGEGDANFKDLQTLYNENKLGGSGLPEPESADKVLLSASSNTVADGLEWKQVSKNDVGLQLPEFESLEEWDSLPADEKSKYYNAGKGYVVIKEDIKGAKGVIDDTRPTSTVTTLSAKKINDSLVDINANLGEKADLKITEVSDLNEAIPTQGYKETFICIDGANRPTSDYCVCESTMNVYNGWKFCTQMGKLLIGNEGESTKTYTRSGHIRSGETTWAWSDWRELATVDNVQLTSKIDISSDNELLSWLRNHPYKQALLYLQYKSSAIGLNEGEFEFFGSRDAGIAKGIFRETYSKSTTYYIEFDLSNTTSLLLRTKVELATMDKMKNGYAKIIKNSDTDTDDAMFIAYKNSELFGVRIYKNDDSEHELRFSASGISYIKNGATIWTK